MNGMVLISRDGFCWSFLLRIVLVKGMNECSNTQDCRYLNMTRQGYILKVKIKPKTSVVHFMTYIRLHIISNLSHYTAAHYVCKGLGTGNTHTINVL